MRLPAFFVYCLGLFFVMPVCAFEDPLGFPLERLPAAQDPEDEPGPTGERDFYGGLPALMMHYRQVSKDSDGHDRAKEIAIQPGNDPSAKPVLLAAPGPLWAVDQTWTFPQARTVMILAPNNNGGGIAAFFSIDVNKLLHQMEYTAVDTSTSVDPDWPYGTQPIAMENDRMYLKEPLPEPLAALFPDRLGLYPNERWWRDYAHPDEVRTVEEWRVNLDYALTQLQSSPNRKFIDSEGLKILERVLQVDPAPVPLGRLSGNYKIRSIQGGHDLIALYPWFRARIGVSDRGRECAFVKLSGSQRRGGDLLLTPSPHFLVFLGGKAVNDELIPPYSTLYDSIDSPRKESDSGGILLAVDADHFFMVVDVFGAEDWEIYELKRLPDS